METTNWGVWILPLDCIQLVKLVRSSQSHGHCFILQIVINVLLVSRVSVINMQSLLIMGAKLKVHGLQTSQPEAAMTWDFGRSFRLEVIQEGFGFPTAHVLIFMPLRIIGCRQGLPKRATYLTGVQLHSNKDICFTCFMKSAPLECAIQLDRGLQQVCQYHSWYARLFPSLWRCPYSKRVNPFAA